MKAVLFPGAAGPLRRLTGGGSEVLLSFAGQPVLFRVVESLARAGIRDVAVCVRGNPGDVRRAAGAGERWGVRLTIIPASDEAGPFALFLRHAAGSSADVIGLPVGVFGGPDPAAYVEAHRKGGADATFFDPPEGWSVRPAALSARLAAFLADRPAGPDEVSAAAEWVGKGFVVREAGREAGSPGLAASSPGAFLEGHRRILDGRIPGFDLPGRSIRRGLWAGFRSRIPGATVVHPPVLIGSHCRISAKARLGPNVFLADGCIVDDRAEIADSVILEKTYIGIGTEIHGAVVRGRYVFDASRGIEIHLADDIVCGDLHRPAFGEWAGRVWDRVLAAVLLTLSAPGLAFAALGWRIRRGRGFLESRTVLGASEVVDLDGTTKPRVFLLYSCRSGNGLISKVPGLWNVVRGDLRLFGPAPLGSEEYRQALSVWMIERLEGQKGLFHPWETGIQDPDLDARLAEEAAYDAGQSPVRDAGRLIRVFIRLAFLRKTSNR